LRSSISVDSVIPQVAGGMDTVGRSTAVTVISPCRRWWAAWLRLDFAALALWKRLLRQKQPSRPVRKLSFINFAHWALVDRIPARGGHGARPLPKPYIVFHSNFNGAAHEYIEAFCRALPWRMRGLWGGAYGTPDPSRLQAFHEHIVDNWVPTQHYYCAYPQASTKMILAALQVRKLFDEFSERAADLEPDRFAEEYAKLVSDLQLYL
jgi:hypothetical protein